MAQDETAGDGRGGPAEHPLPPGLEHLQQAALEAVRAARAVLDAAESVISDPAALETAIRTAAGVARAATETVSGFATGVVRQPGERHRPAGGDRGDDDTGYHDIAVG